MKLRCIECGAIYAPRDTRNQCECGGLLEVELAPQALSRELFDGRLGALEHPLRSGVWRFRELMPELPDDAIVSKPEGNTNLYHDRRLSEYAGVDVWFKHEGENPTGSFKDRGMTVGVSHAQWTGATMVACASTGNTSASVAAYAAAAGIPSVVFVPAGKISVAKLGQTIAYGTHIIQVRGDFDAAMHMVRDASRRYGIYLLNSLNPFRLEGQKSIVLEALQQLRWQVPDWIVIPGGNLGNTSALGKALRESLASGLIDTAPRIAVAQATGAAPLFHAFQRRFETYEPVKALTIATAIQIGDPVNYAKARRVILEFEGTVVAVDDEAIMAAKGQVDRAGVGCEPASAAGLAGIRQLVARGAIEPGQRVLTFLTGHLLKDSDALATEAPMIAIDPTPESLDRALAGIL
ncbi:MAG TPA: threonine synthase [Thermomicrobiales bacterium]|nr:threonine synthase [Thermomicrobiales bacterium]